MRTIIPARDRNACTMPWKMAVVYATVFLCTISELRRPGAGAWVFIALAGIFFGLQLTATAIAGIVLGILRLVTMVHSCDCADECIICCKAFLATLWA